MLGKQAVNPGAGIESTMAHAVNGPSGRVVGGTEMRSAVNGFSGASRLCSSCQGLSDVAPPTAATGFSSLSFYARTGIQHIYTYEKSYKHKPAIREDVLEVKICTVSL